MHMQHAYISDSYEKLKKIKPKRKEERWWEFNRQTKSYERQQEKNNWNQRKSNNSICKESMVTAVTYRFSSSTNYSKMYWRKPKFTRLKIHFNLHLVQRKRIYFMLCSTADCYRRAMCRLVCIRIRMDVVNNVNVVHFSRYEFFNDFIVYKQTNCRNGKKRKCLLHSWGSI